MTTLNEALAERKERERRIKRLSQRLANNVRTPEGEEPSEKPGVLLSQIRAELEDQRRLILAINLTNVSGRINGTGETITEAIAKRDVLKAELGVLREAAEAASHRDRFGESRVKYVTHVDVADLEQKIDEKSRELRELDTRIQRANFEVELVELPAN